MIGFADKIVQERKQGVYGQFVYYECRLPFIACSLKGKVWLSSLDETVAETQEVLGNKRLGTSPSGVIISVLTAAGNEEGKLDLGDMLLGPSLGHE